MTSAARARGPEGPLGRKHCAQGEMPPSRSSRGRGGGAVGWPWPVLPPPGKAQTCPREAGAPRGPPTASQAAGQRLEGSPPADAPWPSAQSSKLQHRTESFSRAHLGALRSEALRAAGLTTRVFARAHRGRPGTPGTPGAVVGVRWDEADACVCAGTGLGRLPSEAHGLPPPRLIRRTRQFPHVPTGPHRSRLVCLCPPG